MSRSLAVGGGPLRLRPNLNTVTSGAGRVGPGGLRRLSGRLLGHSALGLPSQCSAPDPHRDCRFVELGDSASESESVSSQCHRPKTQPEALISHNLNSIITLKVTAQLGTFDQPACDY